MQVQSTLEQSYTGEMDTTVLVNRLLAINVPVAKLRAAKSTTPAFRTTSRYTSEFDRERETSIELCLNREKHSEGLRVEIQWTPSDGSQTTEFDVQIALDPRVIDNPSIRRPWTESAIRKWPNDAKINFYSSHLAGHTGKSGNMEGGLIWEVPRLVLESLYFDFECGEMQHDADGVKPDSKSSPGEANLRVVRFFLRVFVLDGLTSTVLVSDLEALAQGKLLGFFAIDNAMLSVAKVMPKPVQAIMVHVLDNIDKKTKLPDPLSDDTPYSFHGVSAHYVIHRKGFVWQYIEESNRAEHCRYVIRFEPIWGGVYGEREGKRKIKYIPNHDMIALEHEGDAKSEWELRKYVASGWLIQDISARWINITLVEDRLIRHEAIDSQGKECPGKAEIPRLLSIAQGYRPRAPVVGERNDPPLYRDVNPEPARMRPEGAMDVCQQLQQALDNSQGVIHLYERFLAGQVDWKTVKSQTTEVGNAAQGVVGEGLNAPQAVQEAIAELEEFEFGEEGVQGLDIFWGVISEDENEVRKRWAKLEIDRQKHFNEIVLRKMKEQGCSNADE